MIRSIFTALCLSATLHATQVLKLESLQVGEKTYEKATLTLLSGGVVRVIHADGIARVAVDDLPEEVKKSFAPPEEPKVEETQAKVEAPFADPNLIPEKERYRIVRKHIIPNGGETLWVVIAKELATYKDIQSIIDDIRKGTANQRNTYIFIFDDLRSPEMYTRLDDLTEEENKIYDKSFKAIYKKNGATGFHEATITPDGLNGADMQISY
jgi:hypothetical protein